MDNPNEPPASSWTLLPSSRLVLRLVCIVIAFFAGWIAYLVAMTPSAFDGVLSILSFLLTGALVTGLALLVVFLSGVIVRVPGWRSLWKWPLAGLVLIGSIFVMCTASSLGLTEEYLDSHTGSHYQGIRADVALSTWFAMMFAIVHWPFPEQEFPRAEDAVDEDIG